MDNALSIPAPDISGVAPSGAPGTRLLANQRAFDEALGRASRSPEAARETPEQMARRGAEQLVATAFIQPLLKQVRESSMAAPPFRPTQGEKQFGAFIDAKVAEDVVHASNLPIVDRIAASLLRQAGATTATPPEPVIEAIG